MEAPAALQTNTTPRRMRRAREGGGALPLCKSDTTLETFEKRWQTDSSRRSGGSSRTVQALVDRSFLYLGREATA